MQIFYQDIWTQATEDGLSGANELPYFKGDFWPDMLETCIKKVEQEEKKRKKKEKRASDEVSEWIPGCEQYLLVHFYQSV